MANGRVSDALRKEIIKTYDHLIVAVSEAEYKYVEDKIESSILILNSPALGEFGAQLASRARRFRIIARQIIHEKHEGNITDALRERREVAHLVAALYYLCNIFDVIPDHNIHQGYVDDEIVFDECENWLREHAPKAYSVYVKLKRAL